ncbi:hypothetical protein CA13_67300 [Planctomycetes bacterium CA13]|uniref:Uncharacterized protein n=1 Tax=Novipirellula herctigrandis TaxID=2527986 RepID=A0A5C5YN63_9BACT|nr:hypothetical protein CA13_67300 [Planctomycetes bacterium CA13]
MNINPSAAAASIAGISRAAARGGDADSQAADALSKQAIGEKPAGKAAESNAVEAGEQTGDRGGDGRQMYDTFEQSKERDEKQENEAEPKVPLSAPQEPPPHIDFDA